VDWQSVISSDPAILSGKPAVQGTRLAVDFILGLLASGWTQEQILQNYPSLTQESLRAVYAYAAETLSDQTFYPLRREAG